MAKHSFNRLSTAGRLGMTNHRNLWGWDSLKEASIICQKGHVCVLSAKDRISFQCIPMFKKYGRQYLSPGQMSILWNKVPPIASAYKTHSEIFPDISLKQMLVMIVS